MKIFLKPISFSSRDVSTESLICENERVVLQTCFCTTRSVEIEQLSGAFCSVKFLAQQKARKFVWKSNLQRKKGISISGTEVRRHLSGEIFLLFQASQIFPKFLSNLVQYNSLGHSKLPFFKFLRQLPENFCYLRPWRNVSGEKFCGKIFSAYRDILNLPNFVALSEEKTPQEVMKKRNVLPRYPIWRECGRLNTQEGSEAFNLAEKKTFLIRNSVNVEITSSILARWPNQGSKAKNATCALSIHIHAQANNRHQDKREKEAWAWAISFRENRFDFRGNPLQF